MLKIISSFIAEILNIVLVGNAKHEYGYYYTAFTSDMYSSADCKLSLLAVVSVMLLLLPYKQYTII